MWFQYFWAGVIAELRRRGFDKVNHPWSNSNYITVGDFKFSAELARGNRGTIKFEGWSFRRPHGPRSFAAAADLIVKALPKRMEEARKHAEDVRRYEEARKVNRSLEAVKEYLSVYPSSDGKFCAEFRHSDKLTVMAAVDALVDGGFCDRNPPSVGEEEFTETQEQRTIDAIHELLDSLSPEKRRDFASDLYSSYLDPTEKE